jgi:hypothetical protein
MKLETKITIERIDERKNWFFEKNKIGKPLAKATKRKRENTQIHKITNEKWRLQQLQMKSRG